MGWATLVLLFCAGALGGLVNALAGGATLITFPAMLNAGLPPVLANASNAVAVMPGHLIAAVADRAQIPRLNRRTGMMVAASVAGGAVGAAVLMALPEGAFTRPIPALIAFATLMFAFATRIQAWAADRSWLRFSSGAAAPIAVCAASIYGGFFGAGLGVILTAVLSITEGGHIRAIKALKNLLATGVSLAATLIFIQQGSVRWPETLVMLAGAVAGGYAGGRLIQVLHPAFVRAFVIVAGILMFGLYAGRYWL